MKFSRSLGVLACAALVIAIPARAGLTFNITYTAAVQGNANFTQIQSAVNYVENEFSSRYSDNVTLNFVVDQNAKGLGSSLFSDNYFRGSYAQLRAALVADSKSPNDATATALANLPLGDPYTAGCGTCWYATSAEAKALGLPFGNSDPAGDGTYTFNAGVSYTYDPNNRAVAGKYDFIGVTEHEFAELMGRTSQSAAFGYDILDTMRFTSPGARNASGGGGIYFSYDNGNTNLAGYNNANVFGGDRQDFDGTVATDPFNASTGTNQAHLLNSVDIQEMDVIGWDLITTPEPKQLILLVLMIGIAVIARRRFCV